MHCWAADCRGVLTQTNHKAAAMLDVAVIGAGPVGLASAAAILQNLGSDTTVQAGA